MTNYIRPLANIPFEELVPIIYDIINETTIQLGHRTDGKTMALLANTFANDLRYEKRFRVLYVQDIKLAFYNGLRSEDKDFMSIPTFYKWVRAQKKLIDAASYDVHTLHKDPRQVPLYREPVKLLKYKK